MHIISNVEGLLRYAGKNSILEIKSNTVTYVDENEFTYEELKGCYGDRITLVDDEVANKLLSPSEVSDQPDNNIPSSTEIVGDVIVPVIPEEQEDEKETSSVEEVPTSDGVAEEGEAKPEAQTTKEQGEVEVVKIDEIITTSTISVEKKVPKEVVKKPAKSSTKRGGRPRGSKTKTK